MTPLELSLSRHPFFQEFGQAHLASIAACANTAIFDAGTFLFREGEPAHAFFAVQRGRVPGEVKSRGGAARAAPLLTLARRHQ